MAQFSVADYMRKHGTGLATKVVGPDGTKMTIPGFPERMTAASIIRLAEGTTEEAAVKVTLPAAVVNGREVKRNGKVYGDKAVPVIEYAVGKDTDDAPVPLPRSNGQLAAV